MSETQPRHPCASLLQLGTSTSCPVYKLIRLIEKEIGYFECIKSLFNTLDHLYALCLVMFFASCHVLVW